MMRPDGTLARAVLFRRVLSTMGSRAASIAVSFAFAVAVARSLSPGERGDFAVLQALSGVAVVLVNLGVGRSVVYHIGKRLLAPARATGAGVVLAVFGGSLALLVGIPAIMALKSLVFAGIGIGLLTTALGLTAPVLAREYGGATLVAIGRPVSQVFSHAVQPAAGLILLGVVGAAVASTSIRTIVLAWAIGILASAIVTVYSAVRASGARLSFKASDAKLIARFGVWVYPALLTGFLNLRLDQFLVRVVASPAVLGHYAVAVGVGEVLIQIPTVLLWALSGSISSATPEESARLVSWGTKLGITILVVFAVVVAVATPFAVPLVFGRVYTPAVGSVLALLPGMVFYAPAALIADFFVVQQGKPLKAMLVSGSSLVLGAVLTVPLAATLGATGASLAASVAYLVMLVVAVTLFSRDTGIPWTDCLLIGRQDLRGFLQVARGHWHTRRGAKEGLVE
jgi:O-antigen/teichoic acid export membrane protein